MSFPDEKFGDLASFVDAYFSQISDAAASVDKEKIEAATNILNKAYSTGKMVYSCGNGGSAAIANHLVCDHCKLVRTDTDLTPRVVSQCFPINLTHWASLVMC